MTAGPAENPGVHKLLVQQKWRPSLAMIVCAVLTTTTVLPLAGLFFFRLYENQLIRETETELTAQCAVLAAVFEREVGQHISAAVRRWRASPSASTHSPRSSLALISPAIKF